MRARERSELPIRVLSREEEARYGYLAAVNSTTLTEGCVLDLGGGSLQLVRVAGRLAREIGLLAPGHGAHERALPARPTAPPSASSSRSCASTSPSELEGADWLPRAGDAEGAAARRHRRDRAQPRRRRAARRRACPRTACRGW